MNVNYDTGGEEVRIELVSLIDVIFCILTFFILAAVCLARQRSIGVDLPEASTAAPQMRDMLIVSVDYIGQVYIEEQPVRRDQLSTVLQQYNQQNPDGMMVLYASQDARYADVVEVLDTLRQIGGDRAALATIPPQVPNTLPGTGQDAFGIPSDPFNGTSPPANPLDPLNSAPLNPDPLNDPLNGGRDLDGLGLPTTPTVPIEPGTAPPRPDSGAVDE